MKRLIVRWGDQFANIPAERIEEREGIIFAYDDKGLIGAFCLGIVDIIYLS
jgi:hypothetical protein